MLHHETHEPPNLIHCLLAVDAFGQALQSFGILLDEGIYFWYCLFLGFFFGFAFLLFFFGVLLDFRFDDAVCVIAWLPSRTNCLI